MIGASWFWPPPWSRTHGHPRVMPSLASLVNRCPPSVPFPDIARPLFIGLGASDVSGGHVDQEDSDAVDETTAVRQK